MNLNFISEMILIADSGSTKTEWCLIRKENPGKSVFTSGINPYFMSTEDILSMLKHELSGMHQLEPDFIWYYGTGCNSESKNKTVSEALEKYFSPRLVFVGSDLLGAARSLCMRIPGIACIMGTGSNSCYYDGSEIISNVAPLGYILGDEGGAAVLGRKLLTGVLKRQVPEHIRDCFFDTYKITRTEILENVYTKPFPNRFLGQFAKFISANISVPELREIVDSSFDEFIIRNINQYPEAKNLPVNFTGSIAFHFQECLRERLIINQLLPGKIVLAPMQDLVKYHIGGINKE